MSGRGPRRKMDSLLGLLNLHNTGRLFWRLMIDRRVPVSLKFYATSGMVYFFSPLDVIPHDFTGVGLVDDIIVALVISQAFIEMAPPQVVDEHCEALGIDPEKALIPVPTMIQDAMEMFTAATGQRVGFAGQPEQQGWGPPPEYYPPEGHPYYQGQPPPPPYMRYSAYREEK